MAIVNSYVKLPEDKFLYVPVLPYFPIFSKTFPCFLTFRRGFPIEFPYLPPRRGIVAPREL